MRIWLVNLGHEKLRAFAYRQHIENQTKIRLGAKDKLDGQQFVQLQIQIRIVEQELIAAQRVQSASVVAHRQVFQALHQVVCLEKINQSPLY